MAGLIHAHINTYVYTIVTSARAFPEASIHTHTLPLAHNGLLCVLRPVEQRVTELAALLPRLNPHFGSLCVKNTTGFSGVVGRILVVWRRQQS